MCYATPGLLQSVYWGERKHISIHLNHPFHSPEPSFSSQLLITADYQGDWFQTSTIFLNNHDSYSSPTSGAAKQGEHNPQLFLLFTAQPNPGNRVFLMAGPPCETARPRNCGCKWKNRNLPWYGVFKRVCASYTPVLIQSSFCFPHVRNILRKKALGTLFGKGL